MKKKRALVIQAGGESLRMGQDKALAPFRGQPLILRLVERLSDLADELLVTTNHPENLAPILSLPLVPDLLPGRGALGGLYTALDAAHAPRVAVVACDMPFASAALLEAQFAWLEESEADLVVPCTAAGLEPFHAVYRRATCLPFVQEALGRGKRRVDSWFDQARLRYVSPGEIARYDPGGLAFLNVNTPEELKAAEELHE